MGLGKRLTARVAQFSRWKRFKTQDVASRSLDVAFESLTFALSLLEPFDPPGFSDQAPTKSDSLGLRFLPDSHVVALHVPFDPVFNSQNTDRYTAELSKTFKGSTAQMFGKT